MTKRELLLSCCRILHQQSQYMERMAYSLVTMRSDASDDALDRAIDVISPLVTTMCEMTEGFNPEPVTEEEINETLRALIERHPTPERTDGQ